jgi:hypothetical protein
MNWLLRRGTLRQPDGRKGGDMGINRRSGGIEERKRNETNAKAGDEIPEEEKRKPTSRLEVSGEPADDGEKRAVIEKLEKRERES